jgi:predicted alternative tryptophan synthase beta-subunit
VLNHVLLHQTVIGEECMQQLAALGEVPDVIVGCTGGGSNFGGLMFTFMREKLCGPNPRMLMKMHTLIHRFVPDPIHACDPSFFYKLLLLSSAKSASSHGSDNGSGGTVRRQ